jgi:transposase
MPTLISCLDRSMRAFGGVPTYLLTDNERTVADATFQCIGS